MGAKGMVTLPTVFLARHGKMDWNLSGPIVESGHGGHGSAYGR